MLVCYIIRVYMPIIMENAHNSTRYNFADWLFRVSQNCAMRIYMLPDLRVLQLAITPHGKLRNTALMTPTKMAHILKIIFLDENVLISNRLSLNIISKCMIDDTVTLVHVMAWHLTGNGPSSEPLLKCFRYVASLKQNEFIETRDMIVP